MIFRQIPRYNRLEQCKYSIESICDRTKDYKYSNVLLCDNFCNDVFFLNLHKTDIKFEIIRMVKVARFISVDPWRDLSKKEARIYCRTSA